MSWSGLGNAGVGGICELTPLPEICHEQIAHAETFSNTSIQENSNLLFNLLVSHSISFNSCLRNI